MRPTCTFHRCPGTACSDRIDNFGSNHVRNPGAVELGRELEYHRFHVQFTQILEPVW